jgi:hypothetical protein
VPSETVRGHNLGSIACKPSVVSRTGRQMVRRSTTNGLQHPATFFAETEAAAGADLPQFVKGEFDSFLECGILAHGVLRLRRGDCGHNRLVALLPQIVIW